MENRKGTALRITKRPAQIFTPSCFLCCVFLFSAGCGAPGDPVPPSPPVPAAIKDLAGHQAGDGVQLSFTLPSNSIIGEKLPGTIPGALVENYRADGRVSFTDPIAPEETKAHPGGAVTYVVRTRGSQKRASADSNVISVRVFPVPAPIASVEARFTETAVELTWPAPSGTRRACTNHQRLSNLPLGNSSCRSRFASARASAWQARITRGAARFF